MVHVSDESPEREYRLTSSVGPCARVRRKFRSPTWFGDARQSERTILESNYFAGLVNAVSNSLPEPGLVYSQWWFSESTYTRLARLLLHMTMKDTRVAFLGASTLGSVFSHCGDSSTTIIDVDEVLLMRVKSTADQSAQFVPRDISVPLDASLKGRFEVVFSDPPWSRSGLKTFLVRSAEMLSPEGVLVISFPPVFTRPSIRTERRRLLRMAELLGLSFTTELAEFTEYSVPLFEYTAYREHGIELNRPWRKGDVLIFKRCTEATRPVDIPVDVCERWDQYGYGGTRLFLRQNGAAGDGPARIFPVSGSSNFIYDSTSSRTRLWKHARLVSTRNRIADLSGTKQLASILPRLVVRTSGGYDDSGSFKNVLPETHVALSILLGDPKTENSKQGDSRCRYQQERNSHAR